MFTFTCHVFVNVVFIKISMNFNIKKRLFKSTTYFWEFIATLVILFDMFVLFEVWLA